MTDTAAWAVSTRTSSVSGPSARSVPASAGRSPTTCAPNSRWTPWRWRCGDARSRRTRRQQAADRAVRPKLTHRLSPLPAGFPLHVLPLRRTARAPSVTQGSDPGWRHDMAAAGAGPGVPQGGTPERARRRRPAAPPRGSATVALAARRDGGVGANARRGGRDSVARAAHPRGGTPHRSSWVSRAHRRSGRGRPRWTGGPAGGGMPLSAARVTAPAGGVRSPAAGCRRPRAVPGAQGGPLRG